MRLQIFSRAWRSVAAAIAGAAIVWGAEPAAAQPAALRDKWNSDCAALGGKLNFNTGQCVGASASGGPGGGYTAQQQAMLDIAGQLGTALGAAIRQSFEESARQAEINRIQREWAAEQARQRAIAEEAAQRAHNQQLIANMRGAVGGVDLRPLTSGASGQLSMRTAKEMFDTPAANPAPPAPGPADIYVSALQKRNAAQAVLDVRSTDLAAAQKLVAEAERNAADHPGKEASEALDKARALLDQIERDRAAAQVALDRAEADVKAAEVELARAREPNDDPSVVDLRGASSAPTLITALPQSLPRLQAIEDSPGREKWVEGMQAVIDHDWARATDLFKQARALDPGNVALRNAETLAEFTRDNEPDAALRAKLRRPSDEDLAFLFPQTAPKASGALQLPSDADQEFLFFNRVEKSLADLFEEAVLEQVDRDAARADPAAVARREVADSLAIRALVSLQGNRDTEGAIALLDQAAKQAPEVPNYAAARDALKDASRYRPRSLAQPKPLSSQSRPGDPHN